MSDADGPVWKKVLGCFLLPFIIPVMIIVIPLLNLFGLNKKKATPDYVISYLEKFIAGEDGDRDWDDFSSIPLTDPQLENIRQRACDAGPWTALGMDISVLQQLLEEARALQREPK